MSDPLWQHVTPVADKCQEAMHKARAFGSDSADKRAIIAIAELEGHMKWVQQTVHQAHHRGHMGYWWECPKDTCKSTADLLRELESR